MTARKVPDTDAGRRAWVGAILRGFASLMDIAPRVRNPYDNRSDYDALMGDWDAVGSDLRRAIDETAALPTPDQPDPESR